jgi:Lon protease-like protein
MSDDGLREIGCACEIEQVLERMDDGRMNLLVRGTRPLRVVERQGHLAYPAGVVEFIEDRGDGVDPDLLRTAHEAYAELVRRATDREPEDSELDDMSAYSMAATVDFGLDAKQGLLDLRSENARLRLVTRLFRAAIKRLDFVDRAQARARSNGKVRFG